MNTTTEVPKQPLEPITPSKPDNRSRFALLAILGMFIAPVVIAYLLLHTNSWQSLGSKVQGELLTPGIDLSAWVQSDKHWTLVYIAPETCTDACRNALMQMRQIHKALGPNQPRVQRALIHHQPLTPEWQLLIDSTFPHLALITKPLDIPSTMQADIGQAIWLVDPMGQAMLQYPTFSDEHEAILASKKLLKDLKYLLKVSRIG